MKNTKCALIVFVALASLVGSAITIADISVVGAADSGASWDKFVQCRNDCNEQFGGVDVIPPAATRTSYLAYANCVAACERKYWKQFDNEMDSDK